MLQAYEGIIDASGLCTLHQDGGSLRLPESNREGIPFWAVLDHRSAATILQEMIAGNRGRALRMLEECAHCIGSKSLHE